jgi:hypothetical protein
MPAHAIFRDGYSTVIKTTVDHGDAEKRVVSTLLHLLELWNPDEPLATTSVRQFRAAIAAYDAAKRDLANLIADEPTGLTDAFTQYLGVIEEAEALAEMGVS